MCAPGAPDAHREQAYEKVTLRAINRLPTTAKSDANSDLPRPNLQFYTCFDEREESFRRYLESSAQTPDDIETFGVAGFFNLAIRYQAPNFRPEEILAPEGNLPPLEDKMVVRQLNEAHDAAKASLSTLTYEYDRATLNPVLSLVIAAGFLPVSLGRLILASFAPTTQRKLNEKFDARIIPESATDFDAPFQPKPAADKLAQLLKNVGVSKRFARMIVVMGHGARSQNNPFLAAYNCGACCGREGGPNARVMARAANDPAVRKLLRSDHGINIPDDTWIVGGYHDTTSDLVDLYDPHMIPESHHADFERAKNIIDMAREKNAYERCAKFFMADHVKTPAEALEHVETRGSDVAEARPELGHSTNAAVIVGRRELSKGRDFDRRAFLPSYDPYNDDAEGSNLETILAPALVVGSGINLEYFFSTTDGGAGTKVPANVVGNFAIQQGTAGDLLIGLATQMSELHSPLRALYLIDAPIATVEAVLGRREILRNIVRNNWVRFFVRDPDTQQIYRQWYGEYIPVDTTEEDIDPVNPNPNSDPIADYITFDNDHGAYGRSVKKWEDFHTYLAAGIMGASCLLPFYNAGFDLAALSVRDVLVTTGGTTLGLSTLAFSRRYLHGEFMYGRMALLSAALVVGFNIVGAAPNLDDMLVGWTTIGFASTFLIGAFNDRPTARDNAAFAFGAYQLSDAALLSSVALSTVDAADNTLAAPLTALFLIAAANIKSSQFPLTGLFMRSMEGAKPNSALAYAGLSAHVGVVLLTEHMDLWFQYEWARALLVTTGVLTAVQSSTVSYVRADRKGAIASASAATLGAIYVVLAAGQADLALVLCLGHASFRINQVLRSVSSIQSRNQWEADLGAEKIAADQVNPDTYRIAWQLNRLNQDLFKLPDVFSNVDLKEPLNFYNSKASQFAAVAASIALIASFHLPQTDELIAELIRDEPLFAVAILSANVVGSTAVVRFVLGNVLTFNRFRQNRFRV